MKILIVDDTEDARIILASVLSIENFDVEAANNGMEALHKVQLSPPDLIISDILMPQMDGFELCRQIKKDPHLKHIPFIFYTATYTNTRDEQFALSLGASRFVTKPQEPLKLLEIINEVALENKTTPNEPTTSDDQLEHMHARALAQKLDSKVRELERQKDQLRLITDAMPVLISEVDKDCRYRYANKTYEHWYKIPRNQVLGKHIRDVVGDKGIQAIQPYIDKALQGEQVSFETWVTYPNEVKRYIRSLYVPHENKDGSRSGFFALVWDITDNIQVTEEKKQLEKQLQQAQKMEALGQLTGGIAHDFNNMLASIIGFTELANEIVSESNDENLAYYLEQANQAAKRAKDLIAQMLAFSRSGGEILSVNLISLVKESVKMLRPVLPSSIEIRIRVSEEEIPSISADPVQIHQLLMNLCINARDAMTDQGSIEISITKRNSHDKICSACHETIYGDFVELAVIDTGCGITPDVQEHLFELFFTTKDVGKGTGMGLATVHGIVHDYKGHIVVESKPDVGTAFRIFFPPATTESPSDQEWSKMAIEDLRGESRRVMVVDDEESICSFLQAFLEGHGFEVIVFTNSQKALTYFTSHRNELDLVITDQTMPKLTGVDMSQAMLTVKPRLPIILCSGFSEAVNEHSVKSLGIKHYLKKPFTITELLQTIQSSLGKSTDRTSTVA